jgi:hypothetical protein
MLKSTTSPPYQPINFQVGVEGHVWGREPLLGITHEDSVGYTETREYNHNTYQGYYVYMYSHGRDLRVALILVTITALTTCRRQPYWFGSQSPDHRCDVTVMYSKSGTVRDKLRLVIHSRCEGRYVIREQDEDWLHVRVTFYWSNDSSSVTFVACSRKGVGKILTFDTHLSELVNDANETNAVRERIRATSLATAPAGCHGTSDPLLWACCSVL